MVIVEETKTSEYIKQLENENKLLKQRLLENYLSENTEITRLHFVIELLEKKICDLKLKIKDLH